MKVYVLLGCIDYSPSDVVGVFRTVEEAKAAAWSKPYPTGMCGYDDFDILEGAIGECPKHIATSEGRRWRKP
jgi:hypothetical protein